MTERLAFTVEFKPDVTPRRRLRFEPSSEGYWLMYDEQFELSGWRTEGVEQVRDVVAEGMEVLG